jgi:metallo-beta-lactamase class B
MPFMLRQPDDKFDPNAVRRSLICPSNIEGLRLRKLASLGIVGQLRVSCGKPKAYLKGYGRAAFTVISDFLCKAGLKKTMNHYTLRTLLFGLIVASASLLFPACGHGQSDPESRAWNQPVKPFRIIGNIYYVGAAEVSSFLITTPQGHILLDSGLAETVPQIQQNVAKLGFRMSDIKILINSHAHYDHAGGLAALKKLTGAKLMTTQPESELLARGGKEDPQFGDRFAFVPAITDRMLNDGDEVELGGTTMTAHLTPGHTKGCTTWTMKAEEGGKQYNVVFAGSASAPGYKLVDNPKYPKIVEDYERTFRVLKNLECDVFLGAHGSFFSLLEKAILLVQGKQPNPFIDPAGYRTYVDDTEKAFREKLKAQQEAGKN